MAAVSLIYLSVCSMESCLQLQTADSCAAFVILSLLLQRAHWGCSAR